MELNWTEITTNIIVMLAGSGATWLFSNVVKLRRDLDAAFRKIRTLEEAQHVASTRQDDP